MKNLSMLFSALLLLSATPITTFAQDDTSNDVEETTLMEETAEEGSIEENALEGGTLTLPVQSDPDVMNPLFSFDSTTGTILNSLYDPLFDIVEGENVYRLAEDLQVSDDFLTYTLTLKEGMTWHDGQPITADDVVFTINTILDEEQQSYKRDSLIINGEPIEATVIDDLTVEITLPEVSVPFVTDLSKVTPIAAHVFDEGEIIIESEKNQDPVGSGPFVLSEVRSGEYVQVNRYEDYYGGTPILDDIVYRIIADPQASMTALLNEEIDYLSISAEDMETFEDNEGTEVYVYNNNRVSNMIFKLTNEDLQNINVRKAIAYGTDRDELIQGNYGDTGLSEKAYSFYPPGAMYYTEDVEEYEYDPDMARQLLEEAGYAEGDLSLTIGYTNANQQQETYALIMQQQLGEIGINIEVVPMERGAFVQELVDSTSTAFDLAYNSYALGEEPSKYAPLFLSGNPNNFMGYENETVDELFAAGVVETDEEARAAIYEEIQQIVLEDMVVLPIDYPQNVATVNDNIRGFENTELGRFFSDLSNIYFVAD